MESLGELGDHPRLPSGSPVNQSLPQTSLTVGFHGSACPSWPKRAQPPPLLLRKADSKTVLKPHVSLDCWKWEKVLSDESKQNQEKLLVVSH